MGQVKTKEVDGYQAVQLGFDDKFKNVSKPLKGKFDKINVFPKQVLKEFRMDEKKSLDEYKIGDSIGIEKFKVGEMIDVFAKTKGKGFQGSRPNGMDSMEDVKHMVQDFTEQPVLSEQIRIQDASLKEKNPRKNWEVKKRYRNLMLKNCRFSLKDDNLWV